MKKIVSILTIMVLVFCLNGCDNKSDNKTNQTSSLPKIKNIKTIKDRDVLIVGVKGDTYKFGYKDPNSGIIDGFDVDIAKILAKKILGSSKKLKLVAVTTSSRGNMLDNDEIDYIIATFTITEERKKSYDFSSPYYTDKGIGVMVKKDSNINSFKSLNNKKVGVAKNSTAIKTIQEAANRENLKIQFVEFDTYPSIKAALNANIVDSFATNEIIVSQFLTENDIVLNEKFSPQSYGIVAKKGNNELVAVANELINELILSGDMQHIVAKWGL